MTAGGRRLHGRHPQKKGPKKRGRVDRDHQSKQGLLLFIMADGRRSLGGIFRQCRINDQEGKELLKNLITGGYLRLTVNGETPSNLPQNANPIQQTKPFDGFAEILTSELANYVGPVARMLVKRIGFQERGASSTQLHKIINNLALEIEEELDRNAFVMTMRAKVP